MLKFKYKIKVYLGLFLLLVLNFSLKAQTYTFSNTSSNAHNTWNSSNNWASALSKSITVSGVPTSGQVLRQINLNLGSANSTNISTLQARLTDPDGNTVNIIGSGYFYATDFSKYVTISLRDHSKLKRLKDYTNSYLGMPYNQGYYRVETAGSFANFNTTTNVNGNWILEIIENTPTEIAFVSVELVFGESFFYLDISGSSANNNCAGAQCLQSANNEILIGTNDGYPQNQAIYPPLNISGCNWNAEKNNTAWFFFQPTAANVNVSVSGFSNNAQQSVVFKVDGDCGSPTYTMIACPTSMFVGSCNTTTGNQYLYHRTCYDGGIKFNHEYNLTGLTIGDNYLFIVDGQSGANTDFYIELQSGADNGCKGPLPVKISNLEVTCNSYAPELKWTTLSETNNDYFIIERARGKANQKELDFIEVGKVKGNGNSNIKQHYSFIDNIHLLLKEDEKVYYRMKQVDFNGAYEYSNLIAFDCKQKQSFTLYPNPASREVTILSRDNINISDIKILNHIGQQVFDYSLDNQTINLSGLAQGLYLVNVKGVTKRLIIR